VKSRVLLVLLASAACGTSHPDASATGESDRLVGVWDAKLSLTNPYPLGPDRIEARQVCGAIGFVEYRHARDEPLIAGGGSTIGVYDLELQRLGLEWRGENSLPTAFGNDGSQARSRASAVDSIAIELNPGSDERIVLLGVYQAGGIVGDWSARSARGMASGAFSMRPHGSAVPSC